MQDYAEHLQKHIQGDPQIPPIPSSNYQQPPEVHHYMFPTSQPTNSVDNQIHNTIPFRNSNFMGPPVPYIHPSQYISPNNLISAENQGSKQLKNTVPITTATSDNLVSPGTAQYDQVSVNLPVLAKDKTKTVLTTPPPQDLAFPPQPVVMNTPSPVPQSPPFPTPSETPQMFQKKEEKSIQDGCSKLYACDLCPRQFLREANLNRHRKAVHDSLRYLEETCQICNIIFSHKWHLEYHQAAEHGREVNLTCHICQVGPILN